MYLIVGAGRSGICSAQLLEEKGIDYIIYDSKKELDTKAVCEKIGTTKDIKFILGDCTAADFAGIEICVVSPGVSLETPVMQAVAEAGIPIWSEIELAYVFDKGTVIAITGTNGKTTTTSLVYDIFSAWNKNTLLVGNIEIPYTGRVSHSVEGGYTVAEISSFQLETMVTFRPHVSAILNITPDHLNRHKTMENYENIKKSIAKNQTPEDYTVLNYEDPVLREFGKVAHCKVIFFSSARELDEGLFLRGKDIILKENGKETVVVRTDEVNLVGLHNFENIMAAVAMAYYAGIDLDTIRTVTKKFVAVEHRIEFVEEINGVKYYNDSKATNPDAAIKGIDAMPSTTILIGGGSDKKSDYSEWIDHFAKKTKKLILIGITAHDIAAACDKKGFKDYEFADDMPAAVKRCAELAESGDCVLLSPACASFGLFTCYQERGNIFKEEVRSLCDSQSASEKLV